MHIKLISRIAFHKLKDGANRLNITNATANSVVKLELEKGSVLQAWNFQYEIRDGMVIVPNLQSLTSKLQSMVMIIIDNGVPAYMKKITNGDIKLPANLSDNFQLKVGLFVDTITIDGKIPLSENYYLIRESQVTVTSSCENDTLLVTNVGIFIS